MGRPLPRLLADTVIKSTDDGARGVIELSRPGTPSKKMSRRLYDALELLAGSPTFPAWAAAVAAAHPSITPDQLEGLLDALTRGGFLSWPAGEGPSVTTPPPTTTTTTAPTRLSAEIIHASRPAPPPRVRPDLRVAQSERPGAVLVTLPDDTAFEMDEREYRILVALDGSRDVSALVRFFEDKGQSYSPAHLTSFTQMMIERRLVIAEEAPPSTSSSPAFVPPPPSPPLSRQPSAAALVAEFAIDVEDGPALASVGFDAAELADPGEARVDPATPAPGRRLRLLMVAAVVVAVGVVGVCLVPAPLTATAACAVRPFEVSAVRAPVDGVVDQVLVDEGQRVKAGDVLGHLQSPALSAAVATSSAAVDRARADLEVLQTRTPQEEVGSAKARVLALAKETAIAGARLARVRGLVVPGVAAREELERLAAAYTALKAQLAQARAELKLLLAGGRPDELRQQAAALRDLEAQLAIDRAKSEVLALRAPIDGVVSMPARMPERPHGTDVVAVAAAPPLLRSEVDAGVVVFQIVVVERMRVDLAVAERDLDVLQTGLPVTVRIAALPAEEFIGSIVGVGELERGTIRAEAVVDNRDGKLRAAMTGTAELRGADRPIGRLLLRQLSRFTGPGI